MMSLPVPAVMSVVPVTNNAPLCVITPLVDNVMLPNAVDAASAKALASPKLTLLPTNVTASVKLLEVLLAVML